MTALYRESQKFNQWWMWAMLLTVMGVSGFAGWTEYVQNGSWTGMIVGLGVAALTLILFALVTMRTTITKDGIEVRFWPFSRKRIFRDEIAEARVRTYSPIKEYGGWGVKVGAQGKAYNVSGNQGLQLRLKTGERILIGTQRPEELAALMSAYLNEEEIETLELKALQREKAEQLRGRL